MKKTNSSPIKYIILDIDGVVAGKKLGYNYPTPNPKVLTQIIEVNRIIPISFCTAKPYFAARDVIDLLPNNWHISDAGAQFLYPHNHTLSMSNAIATKKLQKLWELLGDCYLELYSREEYYVDSRFYSQEIADKHTVTLQKPPVYFHNFATEILPKEIIKVTVVATSDKEKKLVTEIFSQHDIGLRLSWTFNPKTVPLQFGIIANTGINKGDAVISLLQKLDIKPEEALGVGDSMQDWEFIQHCGFQATLANGMPQLKQLLANNPTQSNVFLAPDVDQNGLVDILKWAKNLII